VGHATHAGMGSRALWNPAGSVDASHVKLRKHSPDDDGFSLVELMTVVLIIGILISVALGSYMAARYRAMDRAAQSAARQGLTSEVTYFADAKVFTDDPATLSNDTPLYTYVNVASADPREISLHVADPPTGNRIILGVRSNSGTCFYIDHDMGPGQTRFGRIDAAGACDPDGAAVPAWTSGW